ncbi:MAG: family 20 glycosylhydrolase [Lentisphaeria bacterium]|nr:family 20 glycosylhydrolase [Lentisphaeria bacterium]
MATHLNIFPAPRKATIKKTTIDLGQAEWIVLPRPFSGHLYNRVHSCATKLGRILNKSIRIAAVPPQDGKVLLSISLDKEPPHEQGFELKLTRTGQSLRAGGEAGAFYGCLAFVQLIEQFGATPASLTIQDEPDFPTRGIMLDVSRCKVPTMDTLKQLIDRLAGMRINHLQLYIEHTFAFSAHRRVWADASPFTHEEIIELDQYCSDRFIELAPNFNSFGHFGRWLKHPEYRHLGECPDKSQGGGCLAPNNASLKLLEELFDEYLPHFSSRLFNVGCDETWELGKGRSKAKAEKTSTTRVYLDFLKKIHQRVESRGRRMQFWGDIILHQPELIKELPEDIVALCWGYQADHPYETQCPAFADAGIEYYVCPGTSAWNSITGRTDNCLGNLENAAQNGAKYGATGYLITDWGDGGHHQVLPISYLGFAAGAAFSWHLKTNREIDLAGALSHHFFSDPTGELGQLCIDLGRTLNHIPGLVRGNCSAINQLLFGKLIDGPYDLSHVTQDQYNAANAWLDQIETSLVRCRPQCDDRTGGLNEFRHAIACSRHAIHRGQFYQFGIGDLDHLKRDLQSLVMSHEEQWLARNRRGGLHESSTRLRNVGNGL